MRAQSALAVVVRPAPGPARAAAPPHASQRSVCRAEASPREPGGRPGGAEQGVASPTVVGTGASDAWLVVALRRVAQRPDSFTARVERAPETDLLTLNANSFSH